MVPRARLAERRSQAHHPALTLVSAPAGFGKTTLLTEWFGTSQPTRSARTGWLALDAGDNDPIVFATYLLAALRSAAPDLGPLVDDALRSGLPLQAVVAAMATELESVDADVTLVLDDYHTIDAAEIHEAMTLLVEHAPEHLRLVIAGRSDPPLPLARWRARGDLLEIRAADLRFTDAEAAAYLGDVMGLTLTPHEVGALEARTEGWIAALQLAALSLQGRDDVAAFIDNFTGDDRFVLDYLAEEVLDRQPDHLRDFVLRTSVLDRLSGPLCDAVTGTTGGKATLEVLDRANLFLVALDDRRQWYRYHHLFADVVRARLLDEQPGSVAELHLRASDWFDRHGEPAAAIRHALAGGHLARAAQLVETAAPATRMSRQESTLRGWLESLPDDLYDDRPVLLLSLIGARMATGDDRGVERLIDRAERWLHPEPGRTPIVHDTELFAQLEPFVEVHRAGLALLAGDTAGTIRHATRVLELVDPADRYRVGAASALIGLAHWSHGDLDEACRRYTAAVDCFTEAGFVSDVLGCSLGLADILIAQGRLHEARRTYEAGLALAEREGAVRGIADMHVGLAELSIEWGRLEDAERRLHAASELGEAAGLPQNPYRWRAAAARLHEARGDLSGALELLHDAERVYNTDFFPPIRPIPAVTARVELLAGGVAAATRWAAERHLAADDPPDYVGEYEHMVVARILLATADGPGPRDEAITPLGRLLAAAEAGRREGSVVQLLALSAVAHDARGDREAAIAVIEQALARAEPEGYVRTLLEAGTGVVELLSDPGLSSGASRYARRVLAAATPGVMPATPPADPERRAAPRGRSFEELSGRELDVLRLLRSDLSGPEIARALHVSVNTLRTHTKSIYTKLGATNRREAVRIAAERGL